jgi:hypothetical protein
MRTSVADNRRLKILLWSTLAVIVAGLAIPFPWGKVSPVPVLLSLLAFATAIAIPIVLGRRRVSFMAVWLAGYVIMYGVLSWHGSYIDANLGGSDNRSIWYPAHCGEAYRAPSGRQRSSLRPLGWFFVPLLLADRWFIHRTQYDVF